jgi:hypothetical protein
VAYPRTMVNDIGDLWFALLMVRGVCVADSPMYALGRFLNPPPRRQR